MSAGRSMSMPDLDLEVALRDLGAVLAPPDRGAATGRAGSDAAATGAAAADAAATDVVLDVAARVRLRIQSEQPRRAGAPWWHALGFTRGPAGGASTRPLRRSLPLAAAALLVAAAVVTAAIGFGLPGIRILLGEPTRPPASTAPSPPSTAPGALLGLGTPLRLEGAVGLLDFEILLPPDPIGPPDAVYLEGSLVTLVWGPGPSLPGTADPGIGLVLVELRATVDQDYIDKLVFSGTSVERIDVEGAPGYWISGDRHEIGYLGPGGERVQDSVRVAGNTLLWTAEGVTYRLEAELTLDQALDLARSLR
jgi:hypothetical protein